MLFFRSSRRVVLVVFLSFLIILLFLHQSIFPNSSVYQRWTVFGEGGLYTVQDQAGISTATPVPVAENGIPAKEDRRPTPWESVKTTFSAAFEYQRSRPADIKQYMLSMLNWERPSWGGHWPPYGDYASKSYDPNRWERFAMDYRPYNSTHDKYNGSEGATSKPYLPFPDYNSPEWRERWHGEYVSCVGPRGKALKDSPYDFVHAYSKLPEGFPNPFVGSYEVVGLDGESCFDRYSRYGPYGITDEDSPKNIADWKAPPSTPDWRTVNWGTLQDRCLELNAARFRTEARNPADRRPPTDLTEVMSKVEPPPYSSLFENRRSDSLPQYHHRTAVLMRTWTGYRYEPNDIMALRAMVSELSLQSGGEYQVFLFVHVKDSTLPIFDDPEVYDRVIQENVPEEFHDMTILWSEAIFPKWYPGVADWQVYWHQFMCLQWFMLTHPQFDYVWNWETDARYTGHHYHFFEKISEFAAKQPRKLLWERNKRYYMPEVHGPYKAFVEQTHADVLNASAHSLIPPPVWGARPYERAVPPQTPIGPRHPHSFDEDKFEWGVDEEADFITLLPMWDPRNTTWSYKDKIWNYVPGAYPKFTPQDGQADWFRHPDFEYINRRVFINTVVRLSRGLILAMHQENLVGRAMQAEMWPSTVALQHGLKAVYAPHPIFSDRHWPQAYAEGVFDARSKVDQDGGSVEEVQGAWTEQGDSPYNHDREHNFKGWSWYFSSDFPRNLYRRWLNMPTVFQNWGEKELVEGGPGADGEFDEKRICMPAMLLHPVKAMAKDRERL